MIEVERTWGQYPGWLDTLTREQQARVIGAYWAMHRRVDKPKQVGKFVKGKALPGRRP